METSSVKTTDGVCVSGAEVYGPVAPTGSLSWPVPGL